MRRVLPLLTISSSPRGGEKPKEGRKKGGREERERNGRKLVGRTEKIGEEEEEGERGCNAA